MAKKHKSKSKNSSDEYATPRWMVKRINKGTNGVDLDPSSGAEKIPIADERYTIEDDGLANPWFGTVYCIHLTRNQTSGSIRGSRSPRKMMLN